MTATGGDGPAHGDAYRQEEAEMDELHPINRTLLAILENQTTRTAKALDGLKADVFDAPPGGDCNTIREIGGHLLQLRRFQLMLLGSPLGAEVADPNSVKSPEELAARLAEAAELVRRAIADHDPDDWLRRPDSPRKGPWPNDTTLERLARPLNDFTSHLGGIRAVRRALANPAEETQ